MMANLAFKKSLACGTRWGQVAKGIEIIKKKVAKGIVDQVPQFEGNPPSCWLSFCQMREIPSIWMIFNLINHS